MGSSFQRSECRYRPGSPVLLPEGPAPVFPRLLSIFFRRFFRLDAYVLTDKALDEAKQLIYNVYYREQHWVPPRGNPSDLRYENGRIRDNLEKMSTWIGVYKEKSEGRELVAVCRVVNGLEFQRYLPQTMLAFTPGDFPRCEVNRVAIRRDCRQGFTYPFLVFAHTFCAYRMGFRSLLGAPASFLVKSLQWLGFIMTFRFRYHPSDAEVTLCYFPLTPSRIALLFFRMSLWKIRRFVRYIIRKSKLRELMVRWEAQEQCRRARI